MLIHFFVNTYCSSLQWIKVSLYLTLITEFLDGTFSVYADANTEPFFRKHLDSDFDIKYIHIKPRNRPYDLIAFVDCSLEKNCGTYHVDKLYGIEMKITISFYFVLKI